MRTNSPIIWTAGVALILTCTLFLGASSLVSADALTFTVTKTEDTVDGACDADCSLREAILAANAGGLPATIVVAPGTYLLTRVGVEDDGASGDLDIRQSMTIRGAGSADVFVDASGLSGRPERVLDINPEALQFITITVSGLTVRNGNQVSASDNSGGGGRARNARLTLTDTAFLSNTVDMAGAAMAGGALYLRDIDLTATDLQCENNSANHGGAIYLLNATFTVEECRFANNAANYGGALYLMNTPLTMSDCVVHANQATEFGGGIYAFGQGITSRKPLIASISDTTISSNTVISVWAPRGGGIDFEGWSDMGDALRIARSTIAGNHATLVPGGGYKSQGGGIYLYNAHLTLEDSTVSNNAASDRINPADLEDSKGGGIYIANPSSTPSVTITASQIVSNVAESAGGLWASAERISMSQSTVAFNDATGTDHESAGRGGGIYIEYDGETGVQLFQQVHIHDNHAARSGGGIFVNGYRLVLQDSEIDHNQTEGQGGGYYGGGLIQSSRIRNNKAAQGGGVSSVRVTTIVSSTIELNEAIDAQAPMGGGIYAGAINNIYQQLTLIGVTVSDNVAKGAAGGNGLARGGGVYFQGQASLIERSRISSNRAQEGGGVWIQSQNGQIADTAIVDNWVLTDSVAAAGWGGGAFLDSPYGYNQACDLLRVTLSNNRAAHSGGGFAGAGKICSSTIQNNEAASDGGGLAVFRATNTVSSTLHHNVAGNHGGGVYLVQAPQRLFEK